MLVPSATASVLPRVKITVCAPKVRTQVSHLGKGSPQTACADFFHSLACAVQQPPEQEYHSHPGIDKMGGRAEYAAHISGECIGEEYFFAKTDAKQQRTDPASTTGKEGEHKGVGIK